MCNMTHYIDLYNLCSHGFYWSVRLIKRNNNLCEMVQKLDFKTKKCQSSFGIFYSRRHFCYSQNSIFTLKFKFIERGNLKPKAVILFFSWNHFLFFLESLACNKYKTKKHQLFQSPATARSVCIT